jgi:hypothetical protein
MNRKKKHRKGRVTKKKLYGGKAKHAYIAGDKDSFTPIVIAGENILDEEYG